MVNAEPCIFIRSLEDAYLAAFREALEWIGIPSLIRSGDYVTIKPNLTFPIFRKGVMTTPEALEAVIIYLKEFTDRITVCESDSGGYNRFSMDEVFARTGIAEFAQRYGVRIVNMSYAASRPVRVRVGFRSLSVPLPRLLLDETNLFVTMPVPKVHSNAFVSLGLKNQWGVIQQPQLRLRLHPFFKEVIYAINKALPTTITVVDGRYGLTRNGPLRGDVVNLNWILVGNNIFVTDYLVSQLMGFDWRRIPYLRFAFEKEGLFSLDGVRFNTDYQQFKSTQFYLSREWTDYPGIATFNSGILAYLGYRSPLARPFHWLLYRFREPFY